jgi:hypothetical protein
MQMFYDDLALEVHNIVPSWYKGNIPVLPVDLHRASVARINEYGRSAGMTQFDIMKVSASFKAFKDLIEPNIDRFIGTEVSFTYELDNIIVTGFYDRLYENYFVENKYTSQPDAYETKFKITSQVGTYFLVNPALEYVIMELTVPPGQRPLTSGKSRPLDESPEEYNERIRHDIMKSPSKYFIGYDRTTKSYGVKFYRTEFESAGLLDELKDRYNEIGLEIKQRMENDSWYKEETGCMMYNSTCEYYDICSTDGYMNEERYELREKPAKPKTNEE